MNRKYYILSILLLLTVLTTYGQSDVTKYLGIIDVENVGQFTFMLTYKTEGNVISGNTVTNAGNKNETKAYITGKVNTDGSIEFSETNILKTNIKDKSTTFCMVSSKLKKSTKLGLEILEGRFKGTDKKNNFCGAGNIHLVKKVTVIPDSVKMVIAAALKDSVTINNKPGVVKQLSTVSLNKVYCNLKNVRVRLYDSGYIDGDEISINYNGRKVDPKYLLTKEGGVFLFNIEKQQDNIILIRTLNEGLNSPNTATIDITSAPGHIDTYQFNAPANSTIAVQLINKNQ